MVDPKASNELGVPSFEDNPFTRQEYISALVHFYRGELTRANTWRLRLDTTTNWAIFVVMGLLSFAYNVPSHSHASLILGMVLVLNFLILEARRYRFFDVWRNRVRMIEENFYGPILTRQLDSPLQYWGELVAEDLLRPRFKITFMQAFRARLLRNYWALFSILLIAWIVKIIMHPISIGDGGSWQANMAVGPIPWWGSLGMVALIHFCLFLIVLLIKSVKTPEESYWSGENPLGQIHDF